VDFKDALRKHVYDLIGYTPLDYERFKRCVVGLDSIPGGVALSNWALKLAPRLPTGRTVLQRLGTEVFRRRDPGYWVRNALVTIKDLNASGHDVVIADCRFPNELSAVINYAAETRITLCPVFCDYRSTRYDAENPHESEKMSQKLLALATAAGLKDGDKIPMEILLKLIHEA